MGARATSPAASADLVASLIIARLTAKAFWLYCVSLLAPGDATSITSRGGPPRRQTIGSYEGTGTAPAHVPVPDLVV